MKINEERNLPIGFIDSGLGGLSVLKEAIKIMPHEDFISVSYTHLLTDKILKILN